jgi:uncharacterized protein (TIGR00369 family)
MMQGNGFSPQNNSRRCFVCGLESQFGLKMRFHGDGASTVRASFTVSSEYQGYPGVVHGGIVAAMLDETGARTLMNSDPDRFMMTARMDIRYRQPVPTETELSLVGTMTRDRGRIAQAHSAIYLPGGEIAAEADLTLVALPESPSQADLDTLGWRVYPAE